jgi:hypothetical protein
MPDARIAKWVSDSGRQGESYILQERVLPRAFLSCRLFTYIQNVRDYEDE